MRTALLTIYFVFTCCYISAQKNNGKADVFLNNTIEKQALRKSTTNNIFTQQSPAFEKFTTANGLSENFIYAITQDSKGFLWIGTHDGLNRYDGYNFKKFIHDASNNNSLPDNTINDICEDRQGNIWLATNAGLCRYNPAQNNFSLILKWITFTDVNQVIAFGNYIIVKHGDGIPTLLIETATGKQFSMDYKDRRNRKMNLKGNFLNGSSKLSKDFNGNIFSAINMNGKMVIWRLDALSKSFLFFKEFNIGKQYATYWVSSFFVTGNNECWLALRGLGILKTDMNSGKIKYAFTGNQMQTGFIKTITRDAYGNIWFTTDAGLLQYEILTGKMKNYSNLYGQGFYKAAAALCVFEDKMGLIWAGTSNGLLKLNPLQSNFGHITADTKSGMALINNFVLGLYSESDGQVRIHYFRDDIFSRLDIFHQSIQHFPIKKYDYNKWVKEILVANPQQLDDSLFQTILISLKLGKNMKISSTNFIIDSSKKIWFVNYTTFSLFKNEKQPIYSGFPFYACKMLGNEIWLATDGDGLICFDVHTGKITKFTTTILSSNTINSNVVTGFLQETNGNMWIATKGGGLNYFDRSKKIFTHFTEEDGLCNNSIYCLVKDLNNRLWLGTSNGLSCFDLATKTFTNYFQADGLVNNEYNRNSACILDDGTILMGGVNGIDYFNPENLAKRNYITSVFISDFQVHGKTVFPMQNISLGYQQNNISISIAQSDFIYPAGNKYKYMLEGVDKNWVLLQGSNTIHYPLLPPGNYTFKVKAAGHNGIWNETPAIISFTILHPWYGSWWFYILLFMGTGFLVYFFMNAHIKNKLRKQQIIIDKQQAISRERMRISAELHDDMGGEISAIKLLSEMNLSNINPQQRLSRISASSIELVQKMNEIVWALNVNNDTLQNLLSFIQKYSVKYLQEFNIDYKYHQQGETPYLAMSGATRRSIFLLVKETLNNIVKHSGASIVKINIETNDFLQIKIQDNGKGIVDKMPENSNGNGLHNMLQRVEAMGGYMKIKNNNGAIIQFSIPLVTNNTKR